MGICARNLMMNVMVIKNGIFLSRRLYEPLEVKSISPIDLGKFTEENKVYETSFENEYTGIIHYKQYNLKRKAGKEKGTMESRK